MFRGGGGGGGGKDLGKNAWEETSIEFVMDTITGVRKQSGYRSRHISNSRF